MIKTTIRRKIARDLIESSLYTRRQRAQFLLGYNRRDARRPREIFEVIRWFGERGKIFNLHFRNIKGKKLDFIEAFPDEGDIDMARHSPPTAMSATPTC